jgi:hypothetical protein
MLQRSRSESYRSAHERDRAKAHRCVVQSTGVFLSNITMFLRTIATLQSAIGIFLKNISALSSAIAITSSPIAVLQSSIGVFLENISPLSSAIGVLQSVISVFLRKRMIVLWSTAIAQRNIAIFITRCATFLECQSILHCPHPQPHPSLGEGSQNCFNLPALPALGYCVHTSYLI